MTNEDAIKFANRLKNNYTIDFNDMADFCDMAIKALEQQPCETAIDKKEVFNILRRNYRGQSVSVDGYCVPANYREDIYDEIKALPFVTPTRKWLPVSGWLPRQGVEVLTCSEDGFTEIQSLEDRYWKNQHGDFLDLEDSDIVAWMPLPEPYKAEKEIEE